MEKKKFEMNLTPLDDLFSTQDQRDNADAERVVSILTKDIENFSNHPFNVEVNDEMLESIKEKGVITPAIVRPKGNGKYELISGHRRKKASEELDINTLPCIIRELTDDEATIIMVDSNFQRKIIFPSAKAFAYKLKYEFVTKNVSKNLT